MKANNRIRDVINQPLQPIATICDVTLQTVNQSPLAMGEIKHKPLKTDYSEIGDENDEEKTRYFHNHNNNNNNNEEVEFRTNLYERTLKSCGVGSFHVLLLLVCGWALASDSAEVQVVSFVLPTACDLMMTSGQKGWLNAIVFVGMLVGGLLLGGAADIKGRRYMLLWSLSINGIFGFASAFSPTFGWFLLFRFLSGVGVGAAMPVIFTYCSEFVDTNRRGPVIGFLACFWMVGNILTCVAARFVLPNVWLGGNIDGFLYFGSWRIFVVLGSVPALTSVLLMLVMPESPMFLQKMGHFEEAANVFRHMLNLNKRKSVKVTDEITEYTEYYKTYVKISDESEDEKYTFGLREMLFRWILKVGKSVVKLFKPPHTTNTIVLILIWFTLSFGFYGLWMWFPEIFKRTEIDGGSTCSLLTTNSSTLTSNLTCQQLTASQKSVYIESLFVALSNIPGNLFTILIVNKLGRRRLMALSMILSALSVFFIPLVRNRAGMVAMSCVFSGMSVAGFNVLDMLSVENYPTELRSTAFGLQSGFGRIAAISGNVVFGALVDDHCAIPLLMVALLLSVGGLITFKLPKTDDTPLS